MKQSYTMNLVESMMQGMINQKIYKGFTRLNNGLFEDCLGQVFTVVLEQSTAVVENSEGGVMSVVSLKMIPVDVAGRI